MSNDFDSLDASRNVEISSTTVEQIMKSTEVMKINL
jgi:hypothetical protein